MTSDATSDAAPADATVVDGAAAGGAGRGHLLFIWTPGGYRLEERPGDPPAVRAHLDLGEQGRFSVQKVGASPYPDDDRPCAFLIREPSA